MKSIAKNLKDLRRDKGLSQAQLAKDLNIGVSTISLYETGDRTPPVDMLIKIAKYFDVSLEDMVGFSNVSTAKKEKSVLIPVAGAVHAGDPAEAIQDIIDYVSIPESWTAGGRRFVGLLVRGDSMAPEYIYGDYIVLEMTSDFYSGDDVVVYINGYDATLKRTKVAGNAVIFYPLNTKYEPITCGPSGPDFKVYGVVRELRRKK